MISMSSWTYTKYGANCDCDDKPAVAVAALQPLAEETSKLTTSSTSAGPDTIVTGAKGHGPFQAWNMEQH